MKRGEPESMFRVEHHGRIAGRTWRSIMRNRLLALAILPALALPFATQASAKGCIKG